MKKCLKPGEKITFCRADKLFYFLKWRNTELTRDLIQYIRKPVCISPFQKFQKLPLILYTQLILHNQSHANVPMATILAFLYLKVRRGLDKGYMSRTKTVAENWDSKTPSVGTILAFFDF